MKRITLLAYLILVFFCFSCGEAASVGSARGISSENLLSDAQHLYILNENVIQNGITVYSTATGQSASLCPNPLCSHGNDSPDCFLLHKRFTSAVLDGSTLYYCAELFGEQRNVLGRYDLEKMQGEYLLSFDRSTGLEKFVKCGKKLYYCVRNEDGSCTVRALDLKSRREKSLYTHDLLIKSLQADGGYLAFETMEGIYLGTADGENVRLAVTLNASMLNTCFWYLRDGYLYYPANRYEPASWQSDGARHETQLMPCDFYRCSADSDEQSGECVLRDVGSAMLYDDGVFYYLPADDFILMKYYFHDQVSGDADLPENLISIPGNRKGIYRFDSVSGETAPVFAAEDLFLTYIYYVSPEVIYAQGISTDGLHIDENGFAAEGLNGFLERYGYYSIHPQTGEYALLERMFSA